MRHLSTILLLVTALVLGFSPRAAVACPAPPAGAHEVCLVRGDAACTQLTADEDSHRGPVSADSPAPEASRDAAGDDGRDSNSERGSSDASVVVNTGFDAPSSNVTLLHAESVGIPAARTTSPAQRPPRS